MIERKIIATIDEIQAILAKLVVKEQVDKSERVLEAMARGRRVATSLGLMIERKASGHHNR